MPYIKFILIVLLFTTLSFSKPNIIDPFSDPSLILGNGQQVDKEQPTYQEESMTPSSSADIINPFSNPSLILGNTQQVDEEQLTYQEESMTPSSSADIINPFSNPSLIQRDLQIVEEIDAQPYQAESYDRQIGINTPSYQKATNQNVLDAQALPSSKNNSQSYNTAVPDIQGSYTLIEGANLNVKKRMEEGYLVIEKLDETNFGYYYTFILEESTPSNFFGIFNYDKGKFHQRVIRDEGSLKTENLTNTKILTDGDKLALEVNIRGGSVNILWKHGIEEIASLKLQKSLKEAKQNYKEIYKNNFSQLKY